jgi:hypothetical protein
LTPDYGAMTTAPVPGRTGIMIGDALMVRLRDITMHGGGAEMLDRRKAVGGMRRGNARRTSGHPLEFLPEGTSAQDGAR